MSLFDKMMHEAKEQAIRNKHCNGKKDCPAPHHLICCLSRKEKKDDVDN